MNSDKLLKTDILDIIFENRNKAYGAYTLRKFYPERLKKAMGFMLIIVIAFVLFMLLPKTQRELITRPYVFAEHKITRVKTEPFIPVKKTEPEIPVAKTGIQGIQKQFTNSPVIVPDPDAGKKIESILPTDVISSIDLDASISGPPVVQSVKVERGNDGIEKKIPKTDKAIPMDIEAVDIRPSFPGGEEALLNFLKRNLQNPYDLENGAVISVKVQFVVGFNGKLKGFVTIQDGGKDYNEEVIRVLKKMPDWIPGKSKGENVSVYYIVPVKFVMSY